MLIKNKKPILFLKLVAVILFLLSLTITKHQIEVVKEDTTEKMMSLDLGFSYLRQLVDPGGGYREDYTPVSEKLKSLIYSIPKIIKYKFFDDNKFERIDISIKFYDYLKLMEDRKRGINDRVLSNPTRINAIIKHKGKDYKAKLRLKGDLAGHWISKHRMSFRVKLKNNKNILGFSGFSIQKPRERQHPYDYTFQSMIRDAGNLASVHKFAHIFVNGEDWGIMDVEEHMSKEFLEKQNRKNSVIVRFSDEKLWQYKQGSKSKYDYYRLSDPSLFLHLYNSSKYLKNEHNRKIYSYLSKNILFKNNNIYDIDSFSKAYIMSSVWNNTHTLKDHNARYYFNPYTLKLEPITTDQEFWIPLQKDTFEVDDKYANILANQSFLDKIQKNLDKVNQVVSNIDNHLSHAQSFFPVDKNKNTTTIEENMKRIYSESEKYLVSPIMEHSKKNYSSNKTIITKFPTEKQASVFQEHLHMRHYTDGSIELYNLLPDSVVVKDILFNGRSFIEDEITVPGYLSSPYPITISTPYLGIHDKSFMVNTEYQGFYRSVKNDITLVSDGIDNPLLLNTASDFDFINKLDEKTYEISKGDWSVKKPIIIDGNLRILPGAKLTFLKNTYIIVKGSINAKGEKDNPITFDALFDTWKGIYVLNANNRSYLENVYFSNISSLDDELLKLTGGINFYKSDVDFNNVRITDVNAEDAINVVDSSFLLSNVYINNTISDGLDSDFSKGVVKHSEFSNIGGDALDFSGSTVLINKTKVINVRDKAVSAGEKSNISIKDSDFNNIGVGVASKDGSFVTILSSKIFDYKMNAAMSYIKKDFYSSPTSLSINDSLVSDGNAYMRQKGTNMTVDNYNVPESEISIKKLYKTKVMTK